MRHPILPIACALALLTGAWLGQAYSLFVPLDPISASETETAGAETAVWQFYDAVDLLLRTGDDAPLRAAISPDFVDHAGRADLPPTSDGLLAYLASLRRTHPALQLDPVELVAHGDRVVAYLEHSGGDAGSIYGIPLVGSSPWAPIDTFRIAGGRVAEHWGDPPNATLTTPLVSESLLIPDGPDLIPTLERITFTAGTPGYDLRKGPAVVIVESGSVTINPDTGEESTLAAGNLLVIPADVEFTTRNPAAGPADVLMLTLVTPVLIMPGEIRAVLPPTGIEIRPLAGGISETVSSGPLAISVGRVTLGSGAQLASHQTTGTELVAVEAGILTPALSNSPSNTWLRHANGHATVARSFAPVLAGSGLNVAPGTTVSYRNEAPSPLTLLVVTIEPATGDRAV